MKAHLASLINALLLVILGLTGYFMSENPSPTAFIPVALGAVLLALNGGVKKENKMIAHIAVLVTLITLGGLFMPLKGAFGRDDMGAIIRVSIMILSTLYAMITFIQSFIAARKAREASNK